MDRQRIKVELLAHVLEEVLLQPIHLAPQAPARSPLQHPHHAWIKQAVQAQEGHSANRRSMSAGRASRGRRNVSSDPPCDPTGFTHFLPGHIQVVRPGIGTVPAA